MTPAQCRAARAFLNICQARLAKAAGIALTTLQGFEDEKSAPAQGQIQAIRVAFEALGIAFINGNGVEAVALNMSALGRDELN